MRSLYVGCHVARAETAGERGAVMGFGDFGREVFVWFPFSKKMERLPYSDLVFVCDSTDITLRDLQFEQLPWAIRNFGEQTEERPFYGMVEELGELAHATLKAKQGIRGTPEEHEIAAKDAIGDMLVYMAHFCSIKGWNLQDILTETWAKVRQRDWKKHPESGEPK